MALTDNLYDPVQAKALGFQSASPTLNPDEMRIANSLSSLVASPPPSSGFQSDSPTLSLDEGQLAGSLGAGAPVPTSPDTTSLGPLPPAPAPDRQAAIATALGTMPMLDGGEPRGRSLEGSRRARTRSVF